MKPIARILVLVDDSQHAERVVRMAARLAKRFGAELSALYSVDPISSTYLTPEISATVVEIARQQFEDGRARAQKTVSSVAAAHGLSVAALDPQGLSSRELIERSRHADLVVMGQRDPDESGAAHPPLAQRLLMSAGRPLLFVPYAGEFDRVGQRVLLAWADSRESARALHDALPILALAESVEVIGFGAHGEHIEPRLDAVVGLLAAHDIAATRSCHIAAAPSIAERIVAPTTVDASIAEKLLSLAADRGADLIVMGGYGHSRAIEFVLGGVTKTMLTAMTVPTLMSH